MLKKSISTVLLALAVVVSLGNDGCSDADIASHNLSKAADYFEINRRIVFYNGITDTYLLTIEGRCSIEHQRSQLEVTCKLGEGRYVKHFLGLSDNVTYLAEQVSAVDVNVYHYRVAFKPQTIMPDLEIRADTGELIDALPEVK